MRVGDKIKFSLRKISALTTQYVPAHCHDESTSPRYVVVPNLFKADLLPQTTQNIPVITLVNNLAWKNKLLINATLTAKTDKNSLMFEMTCLAFFSDRTGVSTETIAVWFLGGKSRGELSYLAPLGSENISAPYFKQCFFREGGLLPPRQSNTTPPSPKTEITNILFYILNFASIIKFKM